MSTQTLTEARKKASPAIIPSRSLIQQPRPSFKPHTDEAIPATSFADSGFGHSFDQISVHSPATPTAQSCPIVAGPRACPFGGACHTCPVHVQTKLTISEPGDEYEQEADRVAEQVIRMPDAHILQRKCAIAGEEGEECRLRAKELSGQAVPAIPESGVPPIVHEVLRSSGQPLDPSTRTFMESRFGHDFNRVRVHTDGLAARSAQAVGAGACTVGNEVVFGQQNYAPHTEVGRRLIAHELAHVVQQSNSDLRLDRKEDKTTRAFTISTNEARQVVRAIVEVVKNGRVPAWGPAHYQQALGNLCDGLVDRTRARRGRLERAEKILTPVVDATDRQTILSTNVETLFGRALMYLNLQPGLPTPQLHQKFEHTHVAKGGETVAEVAKMYKFDTPAPLCHAVYDYPPNMRLQAGDKIYIPYHPKALKQLILASFKMMASARAYVKEFEAKQHVETEKLENYLVIIDAISCVAGMNVGIGFAAKAAAKTGTIAVAASKEAVETLTITAGKTTAELTSLGIDASRTPKRGLALVLRHIFGPLNPSWWASLYAAVSEKEPDAFFFGPEGVAHKRLKELAQKTEHECFLLQIQVDTMTAQLESPIYTHKCPRCSA